MPCRATARAPKRGRVASARAPEHPATTLAIKMHQPMEEAIALLRALVPDRPRHDRTRHDDAAVVLTLARQASERLDQIDDAWIDLLQIARA